MANINNTLSLEDQFTPTMARVIKSLESMEKLLAKNSTQTEIVSKKINGLGTSLQNTSTKSIAFGTILGNSVIEITQKIAELTMGVINLGDNFVLQQSRISLFTKDLSELALVNHQIYESAQRARSGYSDMVANVAQLGITAKNAFANTEELVRFSETVSKTFTIAGASQNMIRAGMLQLNQAMASGRLQGDEFRTITEAAPLILEAIAKSTGKARGELKEMGSQGLITSDVVRKAVLEYAAEVDDKFSKMPVTVGQAFTIIGNKMYTAFGPSIAELTTSAAGLLTKIHDNLGLVTKAVLVLGTTISIVLLPALWSAATAAVTMAAAALATISLPVLIAGGIIGAIGALMVTFPEFMQMMIEGTLGVVNSIQQMVQGIVNTIVGVINVAIMGINKLRQYQNATPYSLMSAPQVGEIDDEETIRKKAQFYTQTFQFKMFELDRKISSFTSKPTGIIPDIMSDWYKDPKTKVSGKVKLYEEDIKLLRDVALKEWVNINRNIVPAVSIQFGDVHQTANINEVMRALDTKLDDLYKNDLGGAPRG